MTAIRVLIVDDSASMRRLIGFVLQGAADIKVVGEAADPHEAREAIKALDPDVITLDVQMPRMDGLDFLEKLMRLRPTPVVMLSSLTHEGGEAAVRAMQLGAVDCMAKPRAGDHPDAEALVAKIRTAAEARPAIARGRNRSQAAAAAPAAGLRDRDYRPDGRILAMGSSTGGVEALTTILSSFPANCLPTVVTQHMPPLFTRSFAARLDRICAPTVKEASDGAPLLPGHVYIAPGDPTHHLEVAGSDRLRCRLRPGSAVSGHCPSVDVLFRSVAKTAGAHAVGVILTGMGRDGAEGLLAMRQAGAATIGQDEGSSTIYGMPKAAFELGAVQQQLPLTKIASEIVVSTSR